MKVALVPVQNSTVFPMRFSLVLLCDSGDGGEDGGDVDDGDGDDDGNDDENEDLSGITTLC
jgi:hypothetical protein